MGNINVTKVNAALGRGLAALQLSENEALAEAYTGSGGESFGSIDTAPSGDSARGGDGGVDNANSDADAFEAYIEQTAMGVAARCNISLDAALDAIVTVADQMAEDGMIPPMPDPEDGSPEELSAWAGAAKTAQLGAEVMRFCMERAGELGHSVGGGTGG
jgi:hypothetical protein